MAKITAERTVHDNVKIVLDQTSALNLSSIMNWSLVANAASTEEDARETLLEASEAIEQLSWELWCALLAAGVDHEDL